MESLGDLRLMTAFCSIFCAGTVSFFFFASAAVYRSGKPAGWLGPDVKDVMRELAAEGAKGFVTCELLSVTADVESYIEVNVECQEVAKELGVDFAVSEFLGDSFDLVYALSQLIEQRVSAKVTNY